jgi:hypothetical protein
MSIYEKECSKILLDEELKQLAIGEMGQQLQWNGLDLEPYRNKQ